MLQGMDKHSMSSPLSPSMGSLLPSRPSPVFLGRQRAVPAATPEGDSSTLSPPSPSSPSSAPAPPLSAARRPNLGSELRTSVADLAGTFPGAPGSKRQMPPLAALSKSSSDPSLAGADASVGALAAQKRVKAFRADMRKTRREERRQKALGSLRFEHVDLEAFWRATQERVLERQRRSTSKESGAELPLASLRRSSTEPGLLFDVSTETTASDTCEDVGSHEARTVARTVSSSVSLSIGNGPGVGSLHRPKRRIAIVGGGPVGLWAATLIAQSHARKSPEAPEIVIFEQRDKLGHCSRKNVYIVLDSVTTGLLNKHVKSENFVSGVALATIETALLHQLRRLLGKNFLRYDSSMQDPMGLLDAGSWDLVLWAAGRRSLDDNIRQTLGCKMNVGDSDDVLVFEMRKFAKAGGDSSKVCLEDLVQAAAQNLTCIVRRAALAAVSQEDGGPSSLQVFLRYAVDNEQKSKKGAPALVAWLWILGVPEELKAARAAKGSGGRSPPGGSLVEAASMEVERLGCAESLSARRLHAVAAALHDRVLRPSSVSLRWVEGSYWSSDRVVCGLPPDQLGRTVPMLLIGDAALGKPFYTGTTLNMHIAEVKALSKLAVIKWGNTVDRCAERAAEPGRHRISPDTAALRPYLEYERRYRDLVLRTPAFRRRAFADSVTTVSPLTQSNVCAAPNDGRVCDEDSAASAVAATTSSILPSRLA